MYGFACSLKGRAKTCDAVERNLRNIIILGFVLCAYFAQRSALDVRYKHRFEVVLECFFVCVFYVSLYTVDCVMNNE